MRYPYSIALVLALHVGGAVSAPAQVAAGGAPACAAARTLGGAGQLPLFLEWYRPALDRPIGREGLAIADLDGDGSNEIVTTSNLDTWVVLHRQGSGYEQVWASLPAASAIVALRAVRLGGETIVLVGHADGTLELVDGVTHRPFRTLATAASRFDGLRVANIDLDAAPEAIYCDDDQILRLDLETGALDPPLAYTCSHLAVGQVDLDAALEIVVAEQDEPGYVLDAATGALEWTNSDGFGFRVEAGDLNLDGRDEVVGASFFNDGIAVYDAVAQTMLYDLPVSNVQSLAIANADADPAPEIVYGDGQFGGVHVLDGADLSEDWTVSNPNSGVPGLAVGNLDGDAAMEVAFGGGDGNRDALFVADAATHLREWESTDFRFGFPTVGGADVDDDGTPEIYYASPIADYTESGVYEIRDGATKGLEAQGTPGSLANFLSIARMTSADVTGSPAHELFFAGMSSFNGRMVCRDLAGTQLWAAQIPFGNGFESVAIGDVDLDGALEAVAAASITAPGEEGTFLYVYDAATGAFEWRTPSMLISGSPQYSLLRLANVDGDPAPEAVVAAFDGRLWVWDLQQRVNQQITLDLDIVGLDTPNLDGVGPAEILVGTSDGLIRTIDDQGDPHTVVGPVGTPVNSLVAHDFTGDSTLDYVYACSGDLLILDGVDGATRWSSGWLGPVAGINDTIRVGDFDGDGEVEILTALERGVALFGTEERDRGLLRDGFETGSLFKWTHQ